MQTTFEVSDYYELLALHRALMEAKFTFFPNDREIAGSPFVAKISHQVVETLIQVELARGHPKKAERWEKWRRIDVTRREWKIALQRISESMKRFPKQWQKWTTQQKVEYCQNVISPFKLEGKMLTKFMEQLEGEDSNVSMP